MWSRVCSALCSLLISLVLCTSSLELNQIQVYPNNDGTAEVFIVRLRNQPYSFNATTAVDVCTSLGVSIASRAQVETAQKYGLQTCRYGWVKENIAVIPRTEENPNCGQNKVGVIVWLTPIERLFDVFCYNSTGQTEATSSTPLNRTLVSKGRFHAQPTSPSLFLSTHPNTNFLGTSSSPQPISTGFNTSVIPTVFSSTVIPMTTKRSQTSTSDISLSSAGYQPSNSSSFTNSVSSTELSTLTFTNSSPVTISSNETDGQLHHGIGFSFGAVILAGIISVLMLLVMAGTGAVWYFKIKRPRRPSPWERICSKDMFETEMWKHTEHENFIMQDDNGDCGDDITLQLNDDAISS